jgi:hypothetical protein
VAKWTDLKDLAHGEQNIYKVRTRKLPSDTELERRRRTDYKQSVDLVERARFTARVIKKGEKIKNPFSWSITNSNYLRPDIEIPVVRAVIVEIPAGPSPDLQLNHINNTPINPATTSYISSFDFIGVDPDLPLPEIGDDIWVDFENRKTLSGPIYLGMKIKGTSNTNDGQSSTSNTAAQPVTLTGTAFPAATGQPVPKVAVTGSDIGKSSDVSANITSTYGMRTIERINLRGDNHRAWDIGVVRGTPVYAIHDGIITTVFYQQHNTSGGGITIGVTSKIDNKEKVVSYSHLDASFVAVGEVVNSGAPLGRTGTAGTGPHLHFAVKEDGTVRPPTIEEASAALKRPVVFKNRK